MNIEVNTSENVKIKNGNILLMLAPFWAPLTPPMGICCLKTFLNKHGYNVKTVDANTAPELWDFHGEYLAELEKYIHEDRKGNFYMMGYDVFMNHLMAYINNDNEEKYKNLIKLLVSKTFFTDINDEQVDSINKVVKSFYCKYEKFLLALFEREKPKLFGVSVYNSTLAPSMYAFKLIKEKYPDTMTIMGGGIFADQLSVNSPNMELFVKKTPYIDKIIVGEGELLFLQLLKGELINEKKVYTLEDINGKYLELSLADLPDFSDFNLQHYSQLAGFASRSCPYQCSFCSETVQWGRYRKKEAKQVANELVDLHNKYNRQLFLLSDSLTNPIISDLSKELISKDVSIYWDGYLRVDKEVCDYENTLLWRQGGYYRARLGIESGSKKVLELMNKMITPEQIKASIMSLAYAGIKTTTYWVIGHPGETEEDFRETLNMLEELKTFIYEADGHPFFYYPTGQVNSQKWTNEVGAATLYPEDYTDMLITQTWQLNVEPNREVIYERVSRFVEQCKRLSIPNPYSLKDINEADKRWKMLHKNAVPALVELGPGNEYIDENKRIKHMPLIKKIQQEDGDFNF